MAALVAARHGHTSRAYRILLQSALHWTQRLNPVGPTHGRRVGEWLRPTTSSSGLSFGRRTAHDVSSPLPASPCMPRSLIFARHRVDAVFAASHLRRRRGARLVAPRTSQLDERSERLRLALSAGGQLQHRKPRPSPLHGDHVISRVDKVSSTGANGRRTGC